MAEKLTIQDIARLAGVSKATISRVLNQKPDVDPATRERVQHIMHEHGFVPSITASGLAGGRNRLIGMLVPSLTWPLIPDLMRGVAEIAEESPYELVLYSISGVNHHVDRSSVIDRILATKLTAGLLAVFPGQSTQHLEELSQHGIPVVLVDDQQPLIEGIVWVGTDNRTGAYDATRHLLGLGHRRIAHIQGPLKYKVSHDRYQGYCDALAEAGISLDPSLVMEGDFMPSGGRKCATAWFSLSPAQRPTAIFAGSDYMAYGVTEVAEEYGLHIPNDIALVGFDDNPLSAHLQPALTTVKQPSYEMGRQAIGLLLQLIEDAQVSQKRWNSNGHSVGLPTHEQRRIKLASHLMVRASCGTPQTQHSLP